MTPRQHALQTITFHVYSCAQGWLDGDGRFTQVFTDARSFEAYTLARSMRDALAVEQEHEAFLVFACIP